jgi:hypothetical protein
VSEALDIEDSVFAAGAWGTPSPTLPTEGEGARRWVGHDGVMNSIGTSPLVGEDGRGVEGLDAASRSPDLDRGWTWFELHWVPAPEAPSP